MCEIALSCHCCSITNQVIDKSYFHICAVVKTPNLRTSNVKPEWAFLERDMFEDIHFVCAEDLENISVLFVQKMKFQSL